MPNANQAIAFSQNPAAAYSYFAGIGITIALGISGNYNAALLSSGAILPDAVGFALIRSQVWGFVNPFRDRDEANPAV